VQGWRWLSPPPLPTSTPQHLLKGSPGPRAPPSTQAVTRLGLTVQNRRKQGPFGQMTPLWGGKDNAQACCEEWLLPTRQIPPDKHSDESPQLLEVLTPQRAPHVCTWESFWIARRTVRSVLRCGGGILKSSWWMQVTEQHWNKKQTSHRVFPSLQPSWMSFFTQRRDSFLTISHALVFLSFPASTSAQGVLRFTFCFQSRGRRNPL